VWCGRLESRAEECDRSVGLLARVGPDRLQLGVAELLGALRDNGPRGPDVHREDDQVLQVEEQADTPHPRARQQGGAQPLGRFAGHEHVPLIEPRKRVDVRAGPRREQGADIADLGVSAVPVGHQPERDRELLLAAPREPQRPSDLGADRAGERPTVGPWVAQRQDRPRRSRGQRGARGNRGGRGLPRLDGPRLLAR
jgi:hypothetical protein